MDSEHTARYSALAAVGVEVVTAAPKPVARGKSIANPETAPTGSWSLLEGSLSRAGLLRDDLAGAQTAQDQEAAYNKHALVMACVRKLHETAAEAELRAGLWTGEEMDWKDSHPFAALLKNPNGWYSGTELVQYVVARMALTGRGYIWKWRNKGGRVGELWPIPTAWVTEIAGDGNRLIAAYRVSVGGKPLTVPVEDMICVRAIDPSGMIGGASALGASGYDYGMDVERQKYLGEYMRNAPLPGMKVRVKGNLSKTQKEDLRQSLKDKAGRGARGNPIILEGDGDAELIGAIGDMDWPGLTGLSESRICAAFGVPPILVGARVGLDRSTFANYGEARKSFYQDTLRPLWASVEAQITRGLFVAEGEQRIVAAFDTAHVAELQEGKDERAARARAGYQAGVLTLNEARAECGLAPIAGGDTFRPIVAAVPQGAAGVP